MFMGNCAHGMDIYSLYVFFAIKANVRGQGEESSETECAQVVNVFE